MPEIIDYCTAGKVEVPNTDQLLQKITLQGDLLSGASGEAASMPQSRAGTFSHLRVLVLEHNRGATTVKLVKQGLQPNPPPPTLQVSFNDNSGFPQLFEDTSTTVSFAAGDSYRWLIDLGSYGTGKKTVLSYISVKVEFSS